MTPTHAGALQVIRESLAFLTVSVEDLPQAALDWKPLPAANSVTVLVAHAVSATPFFLRAGAGRVGSFADYRANERADAFRAAGLARDDLLRMIAECSAEAERILAEGTEKHLAAAVEFAPAGNVTVPGRNGAGTLMAAVGHLREHVGHVQLMHDLWLAEHPS